MQGGGVEYPVYCKMMIMDIASVLRCHPEDLPEDVLRCLAHQMSCVEGIRNSSLEHF